MSITLAQLRALQRQAGTAPPTAPLATGHACVDASLPVSRVDTFAGDAASHATGADQRARSARDDVNARSALDIAHAPAHAPPRATTSIESLRRLLGVRHAPTFVARTRAPLDRTLPGIELEPGLRLIETHQAFDCPHQRLPLAFAKRDTDIDPRDRLVFDTETTGRAGGTGTRAFMVGAADWHVHPVHGDGLRVRQLLITTLGAEPAMLRAFAAWLAPTTVLSSYNGRCYDAPLLRTRYRLARMADALGTLDHVDLLFPTRRRYRGTWENCRLATIERELLGIVREDDLPGSQAPAAWLTYLRGGASSLLGRVCAHNHQDVVTLAQLMLRLVEAHAAD